MDKIILTSESNHEIFYNYLLNGFNVHTVDKIVYDEEKRKYQFVHQKDRNAYLYDEINLIRNEIYDNDLHLFYKK